MSPILNCIAIDDEPPALSIIQSFCGELDYLRLQKTFTRPLEAQRYLELYPVDLLFLDIQMPSVSGVDFYRQVQEQCKMVIFTTAFSEYAVTGFELNAVDYLLKPFTFERFSRACQKAADYHGFLQQPPPQSAAVLFIRADYALIQIQTADILYIEAYDDYLKIYVENQKTVVARMTLKHILDKLDDNFLRVHRSFIVPLNRVSQARNKQLWVAGREIPIGKSYEAEFWDRFGKG